MLTYSNTLFNGLFDNMPSGSAIYEVINDGSRGRDYIIKSFNKVSLGIEGKTREEVVGKSLFELRPNIDDFGLVPVMKEVWETGVPAYFPIQIYQDDNFSNYYENFIFKIPTGEVVTIYNDVTERMETEKSLKENENRYRQMFEKNNAIMLLIDPESGIIVDGNQAAVKFYGYSPDEIKCLNITEINALPREQVFEEMGLAKSERRKHFFFTHRLASGELREVEVHSTPIDIMGDTLLYSIVHDITDRKRAEDTIRKQYYYLEKAQELGQIGTWELDLINNILVWTDQNCRIFGVPEGSVVDYEIFLNKVHPDDREYVDQEWKAAIDGKPYDIEHRLLLDGVVRWVREKADITFDDNGKAVSAIGFTQDISERKRVEEALAQSHKMLARTEAIAHVGSWEWEIDSDVVRWSDELFRIFGIDPDKGAPSYAEHPLVYTPESMQRLDKAVRLCLDKGDPYEIELQAIRADGEIRHCIARGQTQEDENGRTVRLVGSLQDITEWRRTQEDLRETTERLQMITQNMFDMVSMADLEGKVFYASPSHVPFLGWKPDFLAGRNVLEFIHPDDLKAVSASLDELLREHSMKMEEYRCRRADGIYVWLETFGKITLDENGDPMGAIFSSRDITGRKQAYEALHQSEERFELAMNASRDGLFDWNLATNEIYYSPGWKRMLGYEDDELPNDFSVWEELTHPDDVKKSWEMQQELITQKRDRFEMEFRMRHKDGHWVEVLSRANAYFDGSGKAVRMVGTHVDISETRRILQALQQSEEQHKRAQQVAHIGHWELDPKIGTPVWSEEIFRIFGLDPNSDKEPSFTDHDTIVHPDDFPGLDRAVRRAGTDGTPFDLVFRILRPGGEIGWMHAIGTVSRDDQGGISKVFGTAQDVTAIHETQNALSQTQKDLELAQAIARIGFWKYDVTADKPAWTSEMFRIFDRDPALGEPNWEEHRQSIHPEDWERIDKTVQDAIQKGASYRQRFRILRKDGNITWAETIGMVNRDEQGNVQTLSGSVQDISELKRSEEEKKVLEEQILQSQRMESIGRLAGGVAHDFNNMLSVILGHTELAMDQLEEDSPFYNDFMEIRNAAKRSADLTRQLLAFARKQTIAPKVLDLNATVGGMIRMLGRLIGEDIDLAWLPGESLHAVKMDPSQLDHLLANLCVNARDAISGVGKVTIETQNISLDQEYCDNHSGFVPGDYTLLAVSDDGCGMDKETVANIFEPFFTTKKTGEGTGLGLSTVYGIVKQNNGFIKVYSEPEQGTTFRIYLPCHEPQKEADSKKSSEIIEGKGETILLVEDEASIMKMGRTMLERLGYKVLTAEHPGKAIRITQEHAGRIHLLITDVVMPEMNGRDLAESLKASNPGLKVLYMSGYTANVIAHHGVLDEGIHFMQKPFSLAGLASAVSKAIETDGE